MVTTRSIASTLDYAQRLETFHGFWDEDMTTARQLAAIGHVCDRPPLEALEQGSHCISCDAFVQRDISVKGLSSSIYGSSYRQSLATFNFHDPSCIRLQVRIPLEPQAVLPGLYANNMREVRSRWETRTAIHPAAQAANVEQSSSFFSLPTELRLQIYGMILPNVDDIVHLLPFNRDSMRLTSSTAYQKTGPIDRSSINILRTCRDVYEEAVDLLYSVPTFMFTGAAGTKLLYIFLRSIGETGRRLIKFIDVQCGNREDAMAFALLASCPNLREITIRLPRPSILFPRAPIWVNDGMAAMLALSGLEEVRFMLMPQASDTGVPFMCRGHPDAEIIHRELTRPRGTPSSIKSVEGRLDV